ncbi:SDR family NAD(P)-dependent oxidoreductase [Longibacter sp.]|jgi:NAD(P)-dependent dehydrogenase (short-subunit alcohol dehydrogenase family)|uniref:SDR family NAD(P)-dependent oxidoreductase n=1 Tax=Longibacter sp. TaxID=2045415 RepID=UPI003EBA4E30
MPTYDYTDRVVLVTGGTSGIGRATATAFAEQGASVVIAARDAERGDSVVQSIEGKATFVQTDVGDPEQVARLVDEAVATHGRLDVAVNNAAGRTGAGKPTHAFDLDEFDATVDVALRGVWVGMKHQIQQMLDQNDPGGAIVNVSSVNGLGGAPGGSIYSACKAGVLALTKSAAQEYAEQGLRVNALVPGAVDTPMLRSVIQQAAEAQGGDVEAVEEQYAGRSAAGRIGTPEEAAEAVLWLASDAATYVHGHSMIVDGGTTCAVR